MRGDDDSVSPPDGLFTWEGDMTIARGTAAALGLAVLFDWLGGNTARADLVDYVRKNEPRFAWSVREKAAHPQGTVYDLRLTSQVWQGNVWEHQLQVYQPKDAAPNGTMFLWNTGGAPSAFSTQFGMELATRLKAPVAFLYNVPNQPLLDGKVEDALIAETFVRYLKSGNEEWPLLFPMVKSVVKAMDALEAFTQREWKEPTRGFIVSGASKRGWTAWLTGAVDPRVKAIAPLVIDTLKMQEQMPHQLQSFGRYSDMIKDYTNTGLVPLPTTPEAKKLWGMVDPWVYRDRLTMPKLMILGNNDPYWTTDALNLYWDDLQGDKWVTYVPNAGHDLRQQGANGQPDMSRTINALAAFALHQSNGKPMPKLQWKHDQAGGELVVTVKASPEPKSARLWVATAPTADFRKAVWKEAPARIKDGIVSGTVPAPKEGCLAYYADLEYEAGGVPYHLSTQVRIAGKPAAKE
jgi:PhoPQ-activated pathogenicity-related protein